jgi:hypothetical protein
MIDVKCVVQVENGAHEAPEQSHVVVTNYGSAEMGWIEILCNGGFRIRCDGNDLMVAIANAMRVE